MKTLNLGFFKRVMLTVLVGMVNLVYHTNASGFTTYGTAVNASACVSFCGNSTYYKALYATDILAAMGASGSESGSQYVPGGWSSTRCVCVTTAEYNSMTSCRAQVCSNYISGGVESNNVRYNLVAGSCNVYEGCDCAVGYYKYSSTYCSNCMPGYYCKGWTSSSACPKGSYSSGWAASTCTVCSVGYFNGTTGASRCTACSGGYFQSQTGATVCGICPENTYANKVSAATSCISCSSFVPSPSGTKPSPVAGLSSLGTASATGCYVAVGLEFTEPSGDKWAFVNNCHYAS